MKKLLAFSIFLLFSIVVTAQNIEQVRDSIVAEGKKLYRSEMASWYGTDIFLEKFKEQRPNIGGYLSYPEGELTNCIFFSKGDAPSVLATITFDSTFKVSKAKVDGTPRYLTAVEKELHVIRQRALADINSDTLYKTYKNTNLNIIPIIDNGQKKVYVLTGPQVSGVVVFGNDYLIRFDKENNIVSRKVLHQNIIPIDYKKKEKDQVGSAHIHLPQTGDFITATDICTLMLYAKSADWKSHIVVSEKYTNIWNCEENSLIIVPK